jgi:SAM-dependent methyltransferase
MLRQKLRKIFFFSAYEEDNWVKNQAAMIPAGSKVLDVGAGPCRFRPLFAHCDYRTQDFCQHEGSSLGPLADRGQWSYGKIDFICDASSIPIPDGSVDVVLCTQVLEHVPDPICVVKEIARILRGGGKLLLTAPLGCGLHQEPHHYYGGYTPYWYERFLTSAGFEDIVVTPNGGFFKHYGQESQRFSAMIDPRRVPMMSKFILAPIWLLTIPYHRLLLPLACHYLDRLDTHCGFTVGYHVTAVRKKAAQAD